MQRPEGASCGRGHTRRPAAMRPQGGRPAPLSDATPPRAASLRESSSSAAWTRRSPRPTWMNTARSGARAGRGRARRKPAWRVQLGHHWLPAAPSARRATARKRPLFSPHPHRGEVADSVIMDARNYGFVTFRLPADAMAFLEVRRAADRSAQRGRPRGAPQPPRARGTPPAAPCEPGSWGMHAAAACPRPGPRAARGRAASWAGAWQPLLPRPDHPTRSRLPTRCMPPPPPWPPPWPPLQHRDHSIRGRRIDAKAAVPKHLGGNTRLTKKLFVGGTK
jgi:hypothetical protein